jgi:predicted Zn-dependent peptidase
MMPGVAYLYAGGDSKDARTVAAEIRKEARRLTAEGIDEDFYQRVRKAAFGENLRGLNSFENIAVTLTEGYFHGYDPLRFPQVFDTIGKEDIADFLARNITEDRAVLSEITPRDGADTEKEGT